MYADRLFKLETTNLICHWFVLGNHLGIFPREARPEPDRAELSCANASEKYIYI